jgi:hypothetical protein
MFHCLRTGDLPNIVLKRIPPLTPIPPFYYFGYYFKPLDRMAVWLGGDWEDTAWHEAVHAVEARLDLEHDEDRAAEIAAYLVERYRIPDLSLDYRCEECEGDVYWGLEVCWHCGCSLDWGYRIPKRC